MSGKLIYFVPYAHLDTQWRWEYPTTIKKYIKRTIDDNVALLEKYPEYEFNFTGALRYQMMKEYYPEGFEKVKKYVAEGRWHVSGTCLDETDALVPGVESLIRNVLYGHTWQMREFGQSSRDYMLPDCFGFPRNFPTVLKHCGIIGFSTQKLTWGSANGVPFEVGVWRGDDGSELLSAFNPGTYVGKLFKLVGNDKSRLEKLNRLGEKSGVWKSYQYYGTGDIGGAPYEGSIKKCIASSTPTEETKSGVKVVQGSSEGFFDGLTKEEISRLDVYNGDLLLTKHSAGSLTSQAVMKRFNRANEQLAFAAEYVALIAEKAAGLAYPKERIEKNWQRVIGSQMHDILPGTCTPTAYGYAYNDEITALKEWSEIIEDSLEAVAPYASGDGDVLVFNPFECGRDVLLELDADVLGVKGDCELVDSDGKCYQVQENGGVLKTKPHLNAFEIKRFRLENVANVSVNDDAANVSNTVNEAEQKLSLIQTESDYILENKWLKVKINKDGEIYSIENKACGQQILSSPISYHLLKERPTAFPAWNMDWKDRQKPPVAVLSKGSVKIVEDGEVCKTLAVTVKTGDSTFIKEISLSADSKTLDFVEKITWREKGVSLKVNLDLTYDSPKFIYNWESSIAERGINNPKQYEVPSRYFVDVRQGDRGVALLENCKYGFDRPSESCLRMTLLYTPKGKVVTGFIDQRAQDFGEHTIKYSIYPHTENDVDERAKSFNRPARVYKISCAPQKKKDLSLIDVGAGLGAFAVKKAEDGSGFIVRLYNRNKVDLTATVKLSDKTNGVFEVDGLEQVLHAVPLNGLSFEVDCKANEIKSYLIKTVFQTKESESVPVELDFDSRIIGDVLPPEQLQSLNGNVKFKFADGDLNSMTCNGQRIALDRADNQISLIVFAKKNTRFDAHLTGTANAEFSADVSSSLGFIGQYDTRLWRFMPRRADKFKRDYVWLNRCVGVKDGYVKQDKIAAYTTHTIFDGEVQYYKYGYLYQIDVPTCGADGLILPENGNVLILAATCSKRACFIADARHKTDKYDV